MKEKTAKIIRIITVPPVEAFAMLLILYWAKQAEFGNKVSLLMAILFLAIIPVCSYPVASGRKNKECNREGQRNLAFVINFFSYLAAMLAGYCMGCSRALQWVLNDYFLSVLILTVINKVIKIRASGHACSCTLPYLILSYYLGWMVVMICTILYLVEFWASIELKRHTVKEYLLGSAVACLVFLGSMRILW